MSSTLAIFGPLALGLVLLMIASLIGIMLDESECGIIVGAIALVIGIVFFGINSVRATNFELIGNKNGEIVELSDIESNALLSGNIINIDKIKIDPKDIGISFDSTTNNYITIKKYKNCFDDTREEVSIHMTKAVEDN